MDSAEWTAAAGGGAVEGRLSQRRSEAEEAAARELGPSAGGEARCCGAASLPESVWDSGGPSFLNRRKCSVLP